MAALWTPNPLSPSVIRNLGSDFCKINPVKLSVEELSKIKKSVAPGGKKQNKKKNKPDINIEDLRKASKKKPKKQ